jgi:SAM-dependent methyltransferase
MTAPAAPPPRCRVCGSTDVSNLGPPARHLPTTVAGVPIDISDLPETYARCRACGYDFIHPPVPEARLLDCYRRSSGGYWHTDAKVGAARFFDRKRQLLARFTPAIAGSQQQPRILDFGCYDGGFLAHLGPAMDRCGIEPSATAAAHAQERGIRILGRTIDEVDPGAMPPFDAIIIFDVMEHLVAPVQTLAALQRLLKPRGVMLIETGDTGSPDFARLGPLYYYAAYVEHVGFFNRSSIAQAARRAGLDLIHFERSQHSVTGSCHALRARIVNGAYWMLRGLDNVRVPLPRALRNKVRGPVPRLVDPQDHFLAVLRNAPPESGGR